MWVRSVCGCCLQHLRIFLEVSSDVLMKNPCPHTPPQPTGNLSELPPTVTSLNLAGCTLVRGKICGLDQYVDVASEQHLRIFLELSSDVLMKNSCPHTPHQPTGNLSDLPPSVTSLNLAECGQIQGKICGLDQYVDVASEQRQITFQELSSDIAHEQCQPIPTHT